MGADDLVGNGEHKTKSSSAYNTKINLPKNSTAGIPQRIRKMYNSAGLAYSNLVSVGSLC